MSLQDIVAAEKFAGLNRRTYRAFLSPGESPDTTDTASRNDIRGRLGQRRGRDRAENFELRLRGCGRLKTPNINERLIATDQGEMLGETAGASSGDYSERIYGGQGYDVISLRYTSPLTATAGTVATSPTYTLSPITLSNYIKSTIDWDRNGVGQDHVTVPSAQTDFRVYSDLDFYVNSAWRTYAELFIWTRASTGATETDQWDSTVTEFAVSGGALSGTITACRFRLLYNFGTGTVTADWRGVAVLLGLGATGTSYTLT